MSNTFKEQLAVQALLSNALDTGKLRIRQRDTDVFYMQVKIADSVYVTLNQFDFNANPNDAAKEVVPVPLPVAEPVAEVEEELPTNVVRFKPATK